jgi:hypothetical protein
MVDARCSPLAEKKVANVPRQKDDNLPIGKFVFAMRCAPKSSESAEFKRGLRVGEEAERALVAQKLHQAFECLTAASFAIDLAKEPQAETSELVLRASKLLTEAMEELRDAMDGEKGGN